MTIRTSTDYIAIHASATKPSMDIGGKEIRAWHLAKGWKDIGYNLVIRRSGIVDLGRDLDEVGAHVAGFNHNSFGICLVGGLNELTGKAENNFTEIQFITMKIWIRALRTIWPLVKIQGHRDFSPDRNKDGIITKDEWLKDCPCFDVAQWMKESGV
jgi:hypothetical protein